jgi:iron complex outermembrane recepter protein
MSRSESSLGGRLPLRAYRKAGSRLALVVLSACAASSVALAQQTPDSSKSATTVSDAQTLETVTVTAQFRTENLQETPLAITAITGAMLDARGQTSLQDVTAQAPNVILEPNGAGAGNSMRAQIRGIGQTDLDPAVDPGVGIYIDDVYFATLMGSDLALVDLDRVEILRGPQGTLSGMDSLGGSVKLYSQKATGSNDGYVEATYGSLNRVDVRASGDFSLVPDTLFLRLSGVARHQDGFITLYDYACTHPDDPEVISGALPRGNYTSNCKTGTEGAIDYDAVRASLRWLPSSNVEVNWISDATDDNSGTTANTLVNVINPPTSGFAWMNGAVYDGRFIPKNPYSNYANFLDPGVTYSAANIFGSPGTPNGAFAANPNNTETAWGSSVTVDWKISDDMSLKSITAYRHYISGFGDDNSDSPIPLVLEQAQFTHNQASQELRLNGAALGSFLTYTVGGIYFYQHTEYASREDDPFVPYGTPSEPTFDFLGDVTARVKTKAAFANTAWHLFEGLTFNAGVRFTKEDKDFEFEDHAIDGTSPYLPLSNPADPLNGKVGTFNGSHVDYRLDLDYQWTPTLMTYVSWSTGFKGGGITPRPYYPEQVVGFGPETLKSYEIGLKSQWLDNRIRANVAAFWEDYYGYQASANLPQFCVNSQGQPLPAPYNNPCGEYINAADAVGKGLEGEFELHPIDHMMIDASISYIDFKFTRSLIAAVPIGEGAPDVGKTKASFGIQYEALTDGHGSLTPRLDASYTPASCGDLACDSFVQNQAYTLLNGHLTYWSPNKGWSLALEVTNMTNKLYYITKTYTGAYYVDGQIGMPREWALTFRKQF